MFDIRNSTFLVLLGALLLAAFAGTVSKPAQAANECVRVATTRVGDALVNSCGICREVKVRRTRTGEGFPAMRSYRVREHATVDLSFKGPGQSQIVSDEPCPGADEAMVNAPICVQMLQPLGKTPMLANTCQQCRAVKIETRASQGQPARSTYTLQGKSYMPVPWIKPQLARIVSDQACP